MNWIDAKEQVPEFGKECLLYYTITAKNGEVYQYYEVGSLHSTTTGEKYAYHSWVGKGGDSIQPEFWMQLPEPPKKEETEKAKK